ncbi:aminomethyl-transferring glycine dehydrogenase subunit GcvPA [Ruminococcaceae bacterium OttesenSCG-928-A16]|nr:aminomethyl-transferring glycine dehydrogenase subunit GcvPA [Ruminococcaceae bacterium OttesenSCG-928-A16]
MGSYIPSTPASRQQMLNAIGMQHAEELFADIPNEMLAGELAIPPGKSELEVRRILQGMEAQNTVFPTIFRGAGAYRHYIPSIVKQVASKETFVTAYTPYQAEVSQGTLQMIFEYQTEICELTGMDVANASVYDGASAAAEATIMCRERARQTVLVAATAHSDTIDTIQTYSDSAGAPVVPIAAENGVINMQALKEALGPEVACLYLQSPNYFGQLEDAKAAAELCHAAGVKLIYGCNPIALGLLQTPAEAGADIAVGEGQPLGMPLSFGGPYLGFMASTKAMMRRLPGRIAGETTDADGKRCYVLTLQAREQHIRREKALSSVCTNQALCALTATVYLAALGPAGLQQVASQCYSKAHYMAAELEKAGFARRYKGEFFHEFVTECPVEPQKLLTALEAKGILGGLAVEGGILWCCTELNTKEEIDTVVQICKREAQA